MASATSWLRAHAKAVVATLGLAVQAINLWVPSYSDKATSTVATIVAVLTALGVYRVPNRR